jgi:superfamily II DNA or RNA helicase
MQRLKALSDFKTTRMASILSMLKNYRVITFCNSIEQTEKLGKNCVHSKNEDRFLILDDFNAKKIKHITSCDMLSEGMNVTDCRIGLFARINASEIQIKQKLGRILRHEKPVVIIPYFMNTREEEIVNKEILPNFNEEKIFTIHGINEILQYLK